MSKPTTTYSVVQIDERATRVLLTGCEAKEANAIVATLAREDKASRFLSREERAQ